MALNIPVEIWLLIASYVGDEDYDKLINVNSAFFNIIMDGRYREVRIEHINKDFIRRKLVRLHDPIVASRVRRLHVHPRFDPYAYLHWNKAKRDNWGFLKRLKFLCKVSAHIPGVTESPMQSLLAAVECMSNVTELIIYWPVAAITELKPFLPTAWNSFGPSLRSLTLGRSFPSVKRLMMSLTAVAPATRLVALEELCLEFGHDWYDSMWEKMDSIDMGRVVAPFINKFAPQLRHLSISSRSEELDLCPLFSALVPSFPALRHFGIHAPFRQAWSLDRNTLASFLRHNSKTIRTADLVFLPAVISDEDIFIRYFYNEHDDEILASWLEGLSNDPVVLSGLHSLRIYPTHYSQSGFSALVSLARRSAETLTSLTVPVRSLTHEEVTGIVSIFSANRFTDSYNLVTLRLNIRRLDPALVRLLATNLPGLKKLSLRLMNPQNDFREAIEFTASNMQEHFYPDWGLYDLGIWDGYEKVGEGVLRLIANAVPSIKSFWGDGSWRELI